MACSKRREEDPLRNAFGVREFQRSQHLRQRSQPAGSSSALRTQTEPELSSVVHAGHRKSPPAKQDEFPKAQSRLNIPI